MSFLTFLQIGLGSSKLSYFWSLDQRSFETLGVVFVRAYVRPSVRTSVRHAFSRKPFITFF